MLFSPFWRKSKSLEKSKFKNANPTFFAEKSALDACGEWHEMERQ